MALVETKRTLRKRLAGPVGKVYRVATITLVLAFALLIAGLIWFIYFIATGTAELDLFGQFLVVAGLCTLLAITLVAARVALMSRVLRRLLE